MPGPVLLSDIGNVLTFFDFSIAARRVAERSPHPPEALAARLDGIKGPFENGEMDDAEFLQAAVAALDFAGSTDEFAGIWCDIFTENAAMKATLAGLAGRVPMRLLSNTSGLHKDYLLGRFDIFRPFDDGVYSYSARCSKPDEAIFRHTIERFELDPAQTFFIDDLEANIATARRLGFQVHHYRAGDHARLEQELQTWCRRHGLDGGRGPVDAPNSLS